MIPAGYMAKRVVKPIGLQLTGVEDVYSVSSHVSENFADYIDWWKHNGYWLFDSADIIHALAQEHRISLEATSFFYYEIHDKQFDGKCWGTFGPETSLPTRIVPPASKKLAGFDVVTFFAGNAPECSPLSCNGLANEIATNSHCLLETLDEAYEKISGGAFSSGEPGPYRIFAVYCVDAPDMTAVG